ncbi:MAG: hypothetical protein HKO59_08710 [Phycisphaerales bacterium]|nr:hypothetical protein [Phycisphaerae bacterium]NNF45003.1 hypothetical protein [Phycisphaerales bacterium]NNM26050.1 hypothetical protein [Phycisphaerales bacterium]
MQARHRRWVRRAGHALAAVLLGGAGLYLIYGEDKGTGIFAVLIAAILCRLLVIDLDERLS